MAIINRPGLKVEAKDLGAWLVEPPDVDALAAELIGIARARGVPGFTGKSVEAIDLPRRVNFSTVAGGRVDRMLELEEMGAPVDPVLEEILRARIVAHTDRTLLDVLAGGTAFTRSTFADDDAGGVLTVEAIVDAMRSLEANQREMEAAIARDDPLVLILPRSHAYWRAPDDEREAMLLVIMGEAQGRRVNVIPSTEIPDVKGPIFYSIDRAKLDREFWPMGTPLNALPVTHASPAPAWRAEFADIVGGWALPRRVDVADLASRINRAATWAATNGPLNDVEKAALGELIAAHAKALDDERDGGFSDD